MTWNPLKRNNLTSKPTSAPPAICRNDDIELEQLFYRLQNVEESTKKLQKEMKKYLDSVAAAGKSEQKITSDLSTSYMCHQNGQLRQLVEEYHTVTSQVCVSVQDLVRIMQITFQEPLKTFKCQFGNIDATFHRREQLVQEWRNLHTRVKKLEDKERSAGNFVKLERDRRALETATLELASFHNTMLNELLQFLKKRGEFFSPSLQALIRSQLDFHGNTTRLFTHLRPQSQDTKGTPTSAMIPDDQYNQSVHEKLSKIRALSIVKRS